MQISLPSHVIRVRRGRWTGAGVRIAIVDSGVNGRHSHVRGLAQALRATDGDDGTVRWIGDPTDEVGHGTAVAAAIRQKVPRAELYSLKVFDRTLLTHMRYVLAAIHWATEHGMHLVNLSLGSSNDEHIPGLQGAAESALAAGTLLVASSEPAETPVYPAVLPGFVGVRTDPHCDEWSYSLWPGEVLPVGACGYPRRLPDRPPAANFRGTSFAAAHVTGFMALFVHQLGGTSGVLEHVVSAH